MLVTELEVRDERWRHLTPCNCPVVVRDGDGRIVGSCWNHLKTGICSDHGVIYITEETVNDLRKLAAENEAALQELKDQFARLRSKNVTKPGGWVDMVLVGTAAVLAWMVCF